MKILIFILIATISIYAHLNTLDLQTIKFKIKKLESQGKGDIYAENKKGYLGRYQFGAVALVAVGLMKRDAYIKATYFDKKLGIRKWKRGINNKIFINNKNNWNLSRGKNSFLGNEILQENAMDELIRENYTYLRKANLNLSREDEIGFLVATHLGGFSNALKYIKNKIDFKDANGTPISKYYKYGTVKLSEDEQKRVEQMAKKYIGGRYVWGGDTPKGFDCSGYTQYIYKKVGINLPRTALEQSKVGVRVGLDKIKRGDLLFFLTDKSRKIPITHVGIYLGNGKFIHASGKKYGVRISPFSKYKSRFVLAKRVLKGSINFKFLTNYKSIIVDKNFFKSKATRAIFAPTKVVLKQGFKYELVGNKYIRR